jgi:hypothetical protein
MRVQAPNGQLSALTNYVIAVGNYVIVSPSELGNYKIVDSSARLPARKRATSTSRNRESDALTSSSHANPC